MRSLRGGCGLCIATGKQTGEPVGRLIQRLLVNPAETLAEHRKQACVSQVGSPNYY